MKDEYRSKDRLAARLLVSRPWLVRRLEAILGRDGSAEDVAQEAFMSVLDSPPHQGNDNLEGYLWQVAKRRAIDELRKRRPVKSLDSSVPTDALDAMIQSEEAHEIGSLLEGLTDGQRLCLKMLYFDEMHYQDIAKALNISKEQVRAHVQNGRIQLENRWKRRPPGGSRGKVS
jgi:RNA polymerase sigma factor (sigma-70 family)